MIWIEITILMLVCLNRSLLCLKTNKLSHFYCSIIMTKHDNKVKIMKDRLYKSVNIPVKDRGYFFRKGPGEYAEHDRFLGVTNPAVRELAKDCKDMTLTEIASFLESKYNEERFLGLVILTDQYKKDSLHRKEEIYKFYIDNMKYVNNWNLVDASAYFIVGPHLFDKDRDILLLLANSKNMWERRISIVSTFHFIRNNDLMWTFKLAKVLLEDPEDLMHKAVGWMLREAGKKDIAQLLAFLDEHAAIMPRTMLRYSLEKLSLQQRKHYMGLKSKLLTEA